MKKMALVVLVFWTSLASADWVKQAEYNGRYSDVVVIGDVNRDGNLEIYNPIYTSNPDTQNIFVREYDGFEEISCARLPYYAVPWDIGDIDQNGLADMVVQSGDPGMGGNGYLRIYEQTNPNSYPDNLIANLTLPGIKVYHFSQYADLDGDGKKEILMSPNSFSGGGARIYEWDNNQLNLVWEYVGDNVCRKAIGDFNGNGKMEFAFIECTISGENQKINESSGPVAALPVQEKLETCGLMIRVFECVGDNSYQEILSYSYPHSLACLGPSFALDFDGDGKQEFLTCLSTHDIGYRYLIFRWNGTDYELQYDEGENTGFIGYLDAAVADFDQDGCDEFAATIQPWWIRIYNWTPSGLTYFSINEEGLGTYSADFNHNKQPDFYAVIFRPDMGHDRHVEFWEYDQTGVNELICQPSRGNDLKISPSVGKIFRIDSALDDLTLYDIRGVRLGTLRPGLHNLSYLPNGIYFIKSEKTKQSQRIVILK